MRAGYRCPADSQNRPFAATCSITFLPEDSIADRHSDQSGTLQGRFPSLWQDV